MKKLGNFQNDKKISWQGTLCKNDWYTGTRENKSKKKRAT